MTIYTNSTMFVPKYYQMDPETEDLLPDGTELREGMKVLIATDGMRRHIGDPADGVNYRDAMQYNRWFTIVYVGIRYVASTGTVLEIVGEFEDGVKMKLPSLGLQHAWYVKKNTLPEELVDETPVDVEVVGNNPCKFIGIHRKGKRGAMANYGWFLVGMSAAVLTAGTGIFYLWWQIASELAPSCQ